MAYLVSKWRENCVLSAHSSWRLRTNSRTARRQFSTGVNSVPGFSKNHTVTNAIFVDADWSASERSPARRDCTGICFRSIFVTTSSQGRESCGGCRFYFSSKSPPRGTEWLKSGQIPSCWTVYFPFWVHSVGKFVSQITEGGTGQILHEMPHVYMFPCV